MIINSCTADASVLLDAARQLERAARQLRRTVATRDAAQLVMLDRTTLTELRANINAALARIPEGR